MAHRLTTPTEGLKIATMTDGAGGVPRCASRFSISMEQLLILTNSFDVTTDLLLQRLGDVPVFRLNLDQMDRYALRLDSDGFHVSDPTGRTVTSETVGKAYWRKPFNAETEEGDVLTDYVVAEMRYVLAEMVNLLWAEKKLVLVEPFAERRTGKLMQLRYAQGLFTVPAHEVVLNRSPFGDSVVVKSLSNERVGSNVFYSTVVRSCDLDPRYPWFAEQYIEATHDVTVVFVRGRMFAFSIKRDFLDKTIDWRACMFESQNWSSHPLCAELSAAIAEYMRRLKLDFGRLDFLLDVHGQYWFCEVNPNGQFAWLDLGADHGLLAAVTDEISPSTKRYPIPYGHPLGQEK
jgi:hypothetical protein